MFFWYLLHSVKWISMPLSITRIDIFVDFEQKYPIEPLN